MSLHSEHDSVNEALAALRSLYTEEPPPHVESFLTVRLRSERRRKAIRLWRTVAAVSAAAAMLLTWLGTRPVEERRRIPPRTSAYQTPLASPAKEFVTQPVGASHVAVARRPERLARHKRQRPADPNQEDASIVAPFFAIPYTESLAPSEQVDIYRVQLPRTTLSLYGVPTRAGDLEVSVTADVAVGSDGIVRAVRFVR
jgi:hypothetical protein